MRLKERCQPIELILSDVDGVLTDGGVLFDNQAVESKQFFIRDGLGIQLWQKTGYRFGLITGRSSQIVVARARELEIELVRQGVVDKLATVREALRDLKVPISNVCYLGDDLPDIPVLSTVGLGIAVADAPEEVRRAAHHTTQLPGGRGAVRETVEWILKNQNRWDNVIARYVHGGV